MPTRSKPGLLCYWPSRVHCLSAPRTGKPRLARPGRAEFGPEPHQQTLAPRARQPLVPGDSSGLRVKNGPTAVTENKMTGKAATHLSSLAEEGLGQGLQPLIGPGLGA